MNLKKEAQKLVAQMTNEEKASLCAGRDFWHGPGVERLGLKSHMMTDGPHGLRKQEAQADNLGINQSLPSTCFPAACATACSFDRTLLERMGSTLGEKCVREDVGVILGPGINIKRNPLCGRNFEYFSEDPLLAGEMGAALVKGIQSKNTGASLKHFAANNQETNRMTSDSVIDPRALHEIYLPAFETVVKKAQPWTVMCSYNKINGTYANESHWLLTQVLRDEWGYNGTVVSDWGAVSNRIAGIAAGMDLEMPGVGPDTTQLILQAVQNGILKQEQVDLCALRVTELILKMQQQKTVAVRTEEDDDALAHEIAVQSAVLLKNDGTLPLKKEQKVAFIGLMAKQPRYQGAGSSRINPTVLHTPWDAAVQAGYAPLYAQGYTETGAATDTALLQQAIDIAKQAEVAVVFAGLPEAYESEGFDRENMCMPQAHNQLIKEVSAVNPNTVVVLLGGSPMELPWRKQVKSILLMYLGGQAVGNAAVDLLWGEENPSGHLAETWPNTGCDVCSAAYYPGKNNTALYRESIYVGYRYYDAAACDVAYPFGHGLSYTTFSCEALAVKPNGENAFLATCRVTNTGAASGRTAVQLYVSRKDESALFRAPRELRGFEKVTLTAGESTEITIPLEARNFAYYNDAVNAFCIEGGCYEISVGFSSRDLPLHAQVTILGDGKETQMKQQSALTEYQQPGVPFTPSTQQFSQLLGQPLPPEHRLPGEPFTVNSTIGDIQHTFIGKTLIKQAKKSGAAFQDDPTMARMVEAMLYSMPLRSLRMMGKMNWTQVEGLAELANKHWLRGIRKLKR